MTFQPRRQPVAQPRAPGRLAKFGDWLAAHRRAILALQWLIVGCYALLVVLPAFLPHPGSGLRLLSGDWGVAGPVDAGATHQPAEIAWHGRLVLVAQYLFWGVWWPFVILSVLFAGRFWCGVLCPEGALAEFASRHGRGGAIPKWLRWGGWPFFAFVLTTVYGQLISVYEYPQAALLILGGSTVAAVAVGFLFGKGKRVWCRYLCPVSGVFGLLARLAPLHFEVDRARWNAYPQRTPGVDCAPLLNVKKLSGMAECHACGRCSGHRDAVRLAARSPHSEIFGGALPRTSDALLLLFGMLGVSIGAFQWTLSPWFVALKQAAAGWLVDREIFWLLDDSPAWWLLTRHPEVNDVFTWLDGAAILVWIGGASLVLGGSLLLLIQAAARLARLDWRRLALGLVPLAGLGLFLGLSMMTATHLRTEGVWLGWLPVLRGWLLALGVAWSAWLGTRLIAHLGAAGSAPKMLAGALWLVAPALIALTWIQAFFVG